MVEDARTRTDDDDNWHIPDEEREYSASSDDEVPFHIPRD
jgi:hypothetical protein